MADYFSIFTGEQIDSALEVLINSGVNEIELLRVKGHGLGVAVSGKVLAVDSQRNLINLNQLTADVLRERLNSMQDLSSDPVDVPDTGRVYLYMKNGGLYLKNSAGVVSSLAASQEVEVPFTSQVQVQVVHGKNRYSQVQVIRGSDGAKIEGSLIQTKNQFTMSFNTAQTGTLIYYFV